MSGTIICGVDDSKSARRAARVARGLGAELGLRLVFVRAIDAGSPAGEISAVTARLRHLTESTTDVDSGAQWRVEAGHPADRLVAVAKDEQASLIVVGSTGPRSSLLGSISADVSRRAPCPVVVVAPGADASLRTKKRDTSNVKPRTGFPGLFDDGYDGDSSPVDAAWSAGSTAGARAERDPSGRNFAGGIARFGLGHAE
jgi:nucleotide-binding universal stress UspA family protein